MTDILTSTVGFVQRQESTVVAKALEAVEALHDAIALKRSIGLPPLAETVAAINELETMITSLKLTTKNGETDG